MLYQVCGRFGKVWIDSITDDPSCIPLMVENFQDQGAEQVEVNSFSGNLQDWMDY